MENSSKNSQKKSKNNKEPLKLNWDTLLPESKELVVRSEDFSEMNDYSLDEQINRQKSNLEKLKRNLPDNGVKLSARLKLLEDERERRNSRRVNVDGSELLTQANNQIFTSASDDNMEKKPTPLQVPQSEFGELFNKKCDEKHKDSRPENTSGGRFSYLNDGVLRKTRSNGQISTRGQQRKGPTSWKSPFRCDKVSSDLSMKRQKPSPFLASKCSSQSNENTYVMVDDEESDPDPTEQMEQAGEVDECLKNTKVYYPTRNDPESVEICYSDMECLAPREFLSSPIMNFYIRHLQELTPDSEGRSNDYHFFNTYFYNKLQEAVSKDKKQNSFPKLRRWWKGVNIFQKAYILFPVNEDLHWSLVIICIPDKGDDSGPIILHLDSLGVHKSRSIFHNVRSFLVEEWKHLNEGDAPLDLPISERVWKRLPRRVDQKRIEVPQQSNEYDCGLFVLYFMERFIVDAPQRLKRKDLEMFGKKWFKPKEASGLRRKIKKLLKEEFSKAAEDTKNKSLSNQ